MITMTMMMIVMYKGCMGKRKILTMTMMTMMMIMITGPRDVLKTMKMMKTWMKIMEVGDLATVINAPVRDLAEVAKTAEGLVLVAMITVMKGIAKVVSQAMTVIKAGIPITVRAVLMKMVEVVRAREVHTTIIKALDVQAIVTEVALIIIMVIPDVPAMVTEVALIVIMVIPDVPAMVTEVALIVIMVIPDVLQVVPVVVIAIAKIRAGVHQEIRIGVLQEIRTGVLQEIQTGVRPETVVHKVAHDPVHQMEEDKILPAPVAHNQVQVMVGKVWEDVRKAPQKVHRAKTTIATRQRIGQVPYSLLFLHY